MKIVDVAAFYAPKGGGVKTYIDRKLVAGPAAGHEIIVIAPGPENRVEERGPNARIIYLQQPVFPLDHKYHYFRDEDLLHAALDREAPDIVEAGSPWRSAQMVGEWRGSAPRILIMHADPLAVYAYYWLGGIASRAVIDRQFGWFWGHLLRLDRLFTATISASADLTKRWTDGGMSNVITNPMGVANHDFSPALRDEGLRARMLARCGLPPSATLLLGAGRHALDKRWPLVIEAVRAAGSTAPVGLVIVGDGRNRIVTVRAAGDDPHIHLLAPISDRAELARLFASADALIHGSDAETFCMVAAEASASGLPLIVPDRGAVADRAREVGGFLYTAANAASAADAIRAFLASDRAAVRARAVALAPHIRTMDEHFTDLFAFYESIIGSRRLAA